MIAAVWFGLLAACLLAAACRKGAAMSARDIWIVDAKIGRRHVVWCCDTSAEADGMIGWCTSRGYPWQCWTM